VATPGSQGYNDYTVIYTSCQQTLLKQEERDEAVTQT